MKKVIIIDDEPLARSIVKEYLSQRDDLQTVAECGNGFEGVKAIQQHRPDLVILDIQMPKITGFEMLELLDEPPDIIFATAYDEYALKAFDANAIDYLLKPFSKERFDAAIEKWLQKKTDHSRLQPLMNDPLKSADERNRIVIRNNSEISIIPVSDIVYMEAYDDYIKIFTKDKYYLKKKPLSYYEDTLDPALFFRTHRSYIISLQQLTRIEPLEKNTYVALLKSGKKIPLSRTGYAKLKEKLGI
jgi:two-component system, LytTR family, response regulator